jgi:competence protein ComEA
VSGASDPDDPWQRLREPRRRRRGVRGPDAPPPAGDADVDLGAHSGAPGPTRTVGWPHVLVVAAVGLVTVAATGVVLVSSRPSTEVVPLSVQASPSVQSTPTAPASPPSSAAPAPTAEARVVVHVAGRVRRPGVVVLAQGARVVDALEAAGGALPETPLDSVNLARVLADGEQVRVGLPPDPAAQAAAPPPATAGGGPTGLVDLNVAGVTQLDALPGIGPVLAERIVAHRQQNGPFTSVEQLLEVSGIGPAVLADVQGSVTV